MKSLTTAFVLIALISLSPPQAWCQTEDTTTSLESLLQQGLGLFGGMFGNSSSVSAPSITIGSGSSSSTTTTTTNLPSLFGSSFPTIDLGAGSGSGSASSLFDLLFGALPSSTSTSSDSSGQAAQIQSLTNQALNLAQSFSSSFQNILSPQTTSSAEGGASNQTNTQNNLTTIQPLTALTGTSSAITLSSNNGFILSIPGLTFNFGQ